jgi:isoquinoline 1-oxidoreductase
MSEPLPTDVVLEPERYELFAGPAYHFAVDRREFLQAVGGGLVILCLLPEGFAQESGGGRRRGNRGPAATQISSWLHVAEDGTVTAYTGKAEVGQNARTSLTQAVAEELHLPVAAIQLVMSDTARVPYDMGTFGSMTTPTMNAQLRRAAAAAREQLVALAAERWQVDRKSLAAVDGKVTHAASGRSAAFGELTRGMKLVQAVGDAPTAPPAAWKVAGTSVPKVNGRDLVTGRHQYASDIKRPGMLHGKVLRAPALHSTLARLDTKTAEGLPGVTVVHDGSFVGVTAPTELEAERALAALKADWNTTEQPSDTELFDYLRKHATAGRGFGGRSNPGRGSIEEGLKAADHRLEATYTVAYIAHVPLEPRAAVAEWQDGKLTVWTGTQRPFGVRDELVEAFQLSAERVHVIVPDTGSGYGGKHTGEAALEAARLAKASGKPVKLVWTRAEEFTWAYFRPAGILDIKSGVRQDGTLTAWDFHNYNSGGSAIGTPYDVPNQQHGFHGCQSPLRSGSYRCLAATANVFARESHMDELAHAVGMDPLAFRLKNLKEPRLRGVLEAAAKAFGWGAKAPEGHGFGIGCGTEKRGYCASCAEVAVDRSTGRVRVVRVVTAFDCGAVVNPDHLKNQIEGAVIMGLGGALFEAVHFANGRILNAGFTNYRVPRFQDAPALETVLIDRRDVPSAGAGEAPIIGVAPAVGNAIFAAAGVRVRSLPMIPGGRLA